MRLCKLGVARFGGYKNGRIRIKNLHGSCSVRWSGTSKGESEMATARVTIDSAIDGASFDIPITVVLFINFTFDNKGMQRMWPKIQHIHGQT
jgi:hypothetical protein